MYNQEPEEFKRVLGNLRTEFYLVVWAAESFKWLSTPR